MRLYDAQMIATDALKAHGLWDKGWRFGWTSAKKTNGICYYGRKEIKLSRLYVEHNDISRVRLTILHEIAHALAGHPAGHGPTWRAICIRIGGDGKRCGASNVSDVIGHAWVGHCAGGHTVGQHRAPLRVHACALCNSRAWTPQSVIVWRKNGARVPLGAMPVRYQREAIALRAKHGDALPI